MNFYHSTRTFNGHFESKADQGYASYLLKAAENIWPIQNKLTCFSAKRSRTKIYCGSGCYGKNAKKCSLHHGIAS